MRAATIAVAVPLQAMFAIIVVEISSYLHVWDGIRTQKHDTNTSSIPCPLRSIPVL